MGLLFSAAVAAFGLFALAVLAYVVALVRYGWRRAVFFAALFAAGFAVSVAVAAALAALVVGVGSTLESTVSIVAYLAFLAGAGLVGGSFAWRWCAKRSNPALQPTAFGGG